MTGLHSSLTLFGEQLRDAVARDLVTRGAPRAARRRRRALIAIPAGAAAAAAAGAVGLFSAGAPVSSADAAVLRHVDAALSAPAGSIVHERAMVSVGGAAPQLFELWEQTNPPYSYHVIKWGHEGYGSNSRTPDDPAQSLRRLVQSGRAAVAETTFDGIPAYRLTVTGAPDEWVNGTSYVRRDNYLPLEIDTTAGGGQIIRYQAYEYVPSTVASLARVRPAH